jgi:endonuclease YncB( thermonuclease family)
LPNRPPTVSRLVAPKVVAPPSLDLNDLEREPAREPLSDLSLALPPEPEISAEWNGTTLYRPLATESAIFESMGHTVAIAGTRSVALDETCSVDGVSWRCGIRARTAFRLWLRGRALICALPDEKDAAIVTARCRLGKQDAGAWLVSNGWARAAPEGPYAKAEETAKAAKMGIFGPPPDTSGLSDVPDAGPPAPLVDQPVLSDQGIEPEPPPEPLLEFPPPPPAR